MRLAITLGMVALAACGSATIGDPPGEGPDAAVGDTPDAFVPVAPDARVCTDGDARVVDPATGNCLIYFEGVATWLEARNVCIGLGGDLAVPTSMQENDLLWPIATNILSTPDAWLGATDVTDEGTFVWVTAEPLSYTHWRSGEPNNGGTSGNEEDCMVIEDDTLGTWDDRPCSRAYPYFCELP